MLNQRFQHYLLSIFLLLVALLAGCGGTGSQNALASHSANNPSDTHTAITPETDETTHNPETTAALQLVNPDAKTIQPKRISLISKIPSSRS